MFRNKSVSTHDFAMVPRADIPRSQFKMEKAVKTAFDSAVLVPVLVEEVLPGDSFNVRMTCFARLSTPLFPFMDNLHLDSFFFFVPNRLVWTNWVKFMGEQANPADSISYSIPQMVSPAGGYAISSLQDQMGLPTVGQVGGAATITHSALPLRAYNLIFNQWFRDENLQNSVVVDTGDAASVYTDYGIRARGKRHDYFTSCLPWTQKGGSVSLPLTGNATVKTSASNLFTGVQQPLGFLLVNGATLVGGKAVGTSAGGNVGESATAAAIVGNAMYPSNLFADLSTVTNTTINALRLSFQIQKLLERDARGGTRYTEIVLSHFGVRSPDARLQRPEYLGGGSQAVSVSPIAQTSATGVTGSTTPVATLAAMGTVLASGHGFSQSFTEHGYIIGLVSVRADLTYQQGMRKHWSRLTRYDYYFPVFAMLGEQPVYNREIYCVDGAAQDALVFGYQERWAEYRYNPSEIHGLMRSTAAGTLDAWHAAEKFTALPTLNSTFIGDPAGATVDRLVAVPSAPHWLADFFFSMKVARPMPMYSVPGLIDHF